jgi:hypothetical protein
MLAIAVKFLTSLVRISAGTPFFLTALEIFLSPSSEKYCAILGLVHDRFFATSFNSLFANHPTSRRYVVSAVDRFF